MKGSNKRLNIGFFTCHLDNDYAYEVCKGVDYAAKEAGVNLVIFPGMYMNASYNDPKNARFDYQYNSIFYYASKHTLDALIVSIGSIGSFLAESDMIAFLKNFDIPILTIEIEVPGYPCLYTESKTGMRQAVEHLIKEHHKTKIGFVSGRKENADANERLETYKQVLRENNIPVERHRIVYGNFSEFTEDIVNELLDDNPDLEAIVFANDQMAIGGYNAIKARGLEIGKDILVTGYDDSPVSIVLDPLLTTVHNGIMDMGYYAVYEAINLIKNGKTNISILNSNLIVRSSCGCGCYNQEKVLDETKQSCSERNVTALMTIIKDFLFHDYMESFFYNELLEKTRSLLEQLITPIANGDFNFNTEHIRSELNLLLSSKFVANYFNADRLTNCLSSLYHLLLGLVDNDKNSKEISEVFNMIFEAIVLHTSNDLYNKVRQHKSRIWSSMYITRDTLTYSDDEEACFKLMMEKLQDTNFDSSFIYIYEEPVMLLPSGAWKIPKNLYLQACNNNKKTIYLSGDNRLISSDDVFINRYSDDERRKTLVLTPLFTNSVQYGLFVGEIDIEHFENIYSTTLQLSTSLNFISLMKQQLAIQKKLAISAAELNEKNNLLNRLSITDALTGINNRRGFLDSVQMQVSSQYNEGQRAMVVFADMDNLKQVNDLFGHKNGDFAIKSIANILKQSFNVEQDIIGRIGGDEFVAFAFLDNTLRPTEIRNKIAELSKDLNETCGKPYYIDISVGITTFTCSPTLNLEEILHNADEALYENKKSKRKSVVKPTV